MTSQNTKTKKRDRKRSKKTKSERKGGKASKSTDDIYKKFDKIAITEKTNFSEMLDPLVLWAHDDTVEEDKTYRYRMRLGVFNPIVGTNQLNGQNKQTKNNVVLWSDFSEVTKPVEIPLTLYFFPRDLQETTKSLTVTVSRYVLGYWYSKDFTVKTGEMIGRVVEYEPDSDLRDTEQVSLLEEGGRRSIHSPRGAASRFRRLVRRRLNQGRLRDQLQPLLLQAAAAAIVGGDTR